MDMEKEVKCDVKNLIALCHILDEYKDFDEKCMTFFKGEKTYQMILKLISVSKNEHCFNSKKIKKFYIENKKVFDEIRKHSYISDFMIENYVWNDRYHIKVNEMYNYILENRDNLDKIIAVLKKIDKLKIGSIYFNKDFDFTGEIKRCDTIDYRYYTLTYYDDMELIPTYSKNIISYKGTDKTNYMLKFDGPDAYIRRAYNEIYLNSLVFDSEKLPNSLKYCDTVDKIVSLRDELEKEYDDVRNAVDLNGVVEDLTVATNNLKNVIERMDNVKDKEELKQLLLNLRNNMADLDSICIKHDERIIKESNYITENILDKEKQLYKRKMFD